MALAAMAGAGLAGAKPLQTGIQAFKLGAPAYLIPYLFCYAPQITLLGYPFLEGLQASVTALLGVMCLGVAIMGWMFTNVPWWQRVPLFAAALLMIDPGLETDLVGIALLAVVAFLQWRSVRAQRGAKEAVAGMATPVSELEGKDKGRAA